MKKILLIVAFFATTLTFATNVEKNDSQENNFVAEERISENNTSEDETFGCSWTTVHQFKAQVRKPVLSMNEDYDAYIVVTYTYTCTNCYQMGHSGSVTVTTTCV
jgi:hypothetical protein